MKKHLFLILSAGLLIAAALALLLTDAPSSRERGRAGIGLDSRAGLLYEEVPSTGFADYINQVDYALAQTMRRLGLPSSGVRVLSVELKEHNGRLYQEKRLALSGLSDTPLFTRALRDSLIAWAERAALIRPAELPGWNVRDEGVSWDRLIVLDGVITHYLSFSAAPFQDSHPAPRPRLVIVMDDLGESMQAAARLRTLDFRVSFAIWPHSSHARELAELAHEQGLEVLVHQPMEPLDYPAVNPGEGAILAGMTREAINNLLDESIRRVPHAVGLNNHMGSLLTQDEISMQVVAQATHRRGLFILDSVTHPGSRLAGAALNVGAVALKRDIFLDADAEKDQILAQLRKAERLAVVRGQAIAIGHPLHVTLDALEEWQRLRDPEIDLVRLEDLTPLRAFQ